MNQIRPACLLAASYLLCGVVGAAESDGKAVYEKWCHDCHTEGQAGTSALQKRYSGAVPAVLRERTDLQPALIKMLVRSGGLAMPNFRKTEISDAELEALANFLSAGNKDK